MPYTPPQHEDAAAAATAQSAAEAAAGAAATAVQNASDAQSSANEALGDAQSAQSTADEALGMAQSAEADAQTGISNAAGAQDAANAALGMAEVMMVHIAGSAYDGYFIGVESNVFNVPGVNAGPWDENTTYNSGDWVTYDGDTWKSNDSTTGEDVPGESEKWDQTDVVLDLAALTSSDVEVLRVLKELDAVVTLLLGSGIFIGESLQDDIFTKLPNLVTVNVDSSALTSLGALPATVTDFSCAGSCLGDLSMLVDGLQYLACGNTNITFLPSVLPSALLELRCEYLPITSLPALPSGLTLLDCMGCSQLTALPETLPTGLTTLNCGDCDLTELPDLPDSLTALDCHDNSAIDELPTLPDGLLELNCSNTALPSLPSLPSGLQVLRCSGLSISAIPTLPESISVLDCSRVSLTPSDLQAVLEELVANEVTAGTLNCWQGNTAALTNGAIDALVTLATQRSWSVYWDVPNGWDVEATYIEGDYCIYDGYLWKANDETTGDEPGGEGVTVWDNMNWSP